MNHTFSHGGEERGYLYYPDVVSCDDLHPHLTCDLNLNCSLNAEPHVEYS